MTWIVALIAGAPTFGTSDVLWLCWAGDSHWSALVTYIAATVARFAAHGFA